MGLNSKCLTWQTFLFFIINDACRQWFLICYINLICLKNLNELVLIDWIQFSALSALFQPCNAERISNNCYCLNNVRTNLCLWYFQTNVYKRWKLPCDQSNLFMHLSDLHMHELKKKPIDFKLCLWLPKSEWGKRMSYLSQLGPQCLFDAVLR